MSIPGQQVINVGLPNESANSDSLYTAFTKANTNFSTLFNSASPFNTFNAGNGIGVNANANTGIVTITNTGVTNIIAGTNITISQANGNVTISSNGGGNGSGGTVTSVGIEPVSNTRLTVTGSPIISSGTMYVDLAPSGVTAGSYSNPNVTIDTYGRITSASNGAIAGTVTSVGLTPGPGMQISGGPITSNGNITVTNTGVLRLNAGAGILLSSGNGNVTISANTSSGTVTAVGVSSSQLVVTGSPIVTAGTIGINLPNSATFSGTVTAGNLVSTGTANVTGNVSAGNLVLTTGNIIYTPRYGSFYSNTTQSNPVANTAMAMTFNNTYSANGVSVVSNSRLTVAKAGVYNIQFSAQVTKTDAGTDYVEIWLSKNGTAVPWSSTRLKLESANEYEVASWNFVESLAANGYVELMWGSADTDAKLAAIPSANTTMGIDVPSVIVTITPVGA